MKKIFSKISRANLTEVTLAIAPRIGPGVIIFFDGHPGAGKTFLITELLKQHQIAQVSSPTFALHHQYISGTQKLIFHHFDLYRIESVDDLETVGLWERFSENQMEMNACYLIEWGAKFPDEIWPINLEKIWIKISWDGDGDTREYSVS